MLMATPVFTPYIGVSPGTTTVQLGSGSWPMPRGENPGGELSYGMRVPPCNTCQREKLRDMYYFEPYADEARLRGWGLGATGLRWDLFALALGVSFAGVLGFSLLKKKRPV